jgi:hypothetical protein
MIFSGDPAPPCPTRFCTPSVLGHAQLLIAGFVLLLVVSALPIIESLAEKTQSRRGNKTPAYKTVFPFPDPN